MMKQFRQTIFLGMTVLAVTACGKKDDDGGSSSTTSKLSDQGVSLDSVTDTQAGTEIQSFYSSNSGYGSLGIISHDRSLLGQNVTTRGLVIRCTIRNRATNTKRLEYLQRLLQSAQERAQKGESYKIEGSRYFAGDVATVLQRAIQNLQSSNGTNGFGNTFGNTYGNTFGNTYGNTFGNTYGNTYGNTVGNTYGNYGYGNYGNGYGNYGNSYGNGYGNTFGNNQYNNAASCPSILAVGPIGKY